MNVNRWVANGIAERKFKPEHSTGIGAGGVDEGKSEVDLTKGGVRVEQTLNCQVNKLISLEGVYDCVNSCKYYFLTVHLAPYRVCSLLYHEIKIVVSLGVGLIPTVDSISTLFDDIRHLNL